MPRGGQWAIALVLVVLGFMLSVQWRVQQKVAAARVSVERVEDLTQQLRGVERERDALTKEVADLRTQVQNLANREAHYKDLAGELERLRLAAGLVPLEGPGVRVVLDDSARPWRPGENPNAFIIHDEDLLRVVNELLASGAEAVAVNGQRLTARSEIRCVGPTVMVNGVRTTTPVEILAIGHPDTLERGLRLKGGVLDVLELYSIQVSVDKKPQVRIPAYRGSLQFDYARPVSE